MYSVEKHACVRAWKWIWELEWGLCNRGFNFVWSECKLRIVIILIRKEINKKLVLNINDVNKFKLGGVVIT